jgi:hypothetical protein
VKKIILVFCSCLVLSSCFSTFNCNEWITEEVVPKEYQGLVKSKIVSSSDMGKIVFTSNDTMTVCRTSPSGFWNKIMVNDFICKKKGERLIKVYSRNTHTVNSYDFPCCDW